MERNGRDLRVALSPRQPLGPIASEDLIKLRGRSFRALYDSTNDVHVTAGSDDPTYIIGRKGAGKTAFLVGTALTDDADVVLLKSEDVYTEIEKLRNTVSSSVAPVFADTLATVWEVLLFHAAMLACIHSTKPGADRAKRTLRGYLSHYGRLDTLDAGKIMAKVGAALAKQIVDAPPGLTVRDSCNGLRNPRGGYLRAKEALVEFILAVPERQRICVVVDNLEDLHIHIDDLQHTLRGLFRATRDGTNSEIFPFKVRFAFPAELLRRLQMLTANTDKDFDNYILIRWTAGELISLAGNRLRSYLDLYHPDAYQRLRLPARHDSRDTFAAELTLRSLLPRDEIETGLGAYEDPVAYIMRHTQLLPRHLIQLLNEIFRRAIRSSGEAIPLATRDQIISGIRTIEDRMVEGILSTYSHDYPHIANGLDLLKNHIPNTMRFSALHEAFNRASGTRSGVNYEQFLESALAVGAIGIVERQTKRYVVGHFSYTFAGTLSPVEDQDTMCIHPLFMYRLFDPRQIRALRMSGAMPVYPYGTDVSDTGHEL